MIFRAWRGWAPKGRFLCSSAGHTKLFGCHWGLAVCSNGEWQYSSNILWLGNQINDSHTCCQSTRQPLRAVREAHVRRHLPSWGLQFPVEVKPWSSVARWLALSAVLPTARHSQPHSACEPGLVSAPTPPSFLLSVPSLPLGPFFFLPPLFGFL